MLATARRLAGAAVWYVLIAIRWAHATFVQRPAEFWLDTVLGNWEEATKSAVRESFAVVSRWLNGLSAQVVSLFFDASYYSNLRAGDRRPTAWQHWWAAKSSGGTFNAVLERDGLVRARLSPSQSPSPALPRMPQGSMPRASSSYDQLLYSQQQRQQEILADASSAAAAAAGSPGAPVRPWCWLAVLWPFSLAAAGSSGAGASSSSSLCSDAGGSMSGGGGGGDISRRSPFLGLGMRRSGSELFDRPSGYAAAEGMRQQRRGLLEESRLGLEMAVTAIFQALRTAVRTLLLLPKHRKWEPAGRRSGGPAAVRHRDRTCNFEFEFGEDSGSKRRWPAGSGGRRDGGASSGTGIAGATRTEERLARTRSFGSLEGMQVWTVSDVILQAGYPLEEHVVTTGDGYILHMQRIPRRGARDVVFFQHGILDTSLGWVSNGIQGSQAFAAWDAGFDVFLGNARSNPPRMHADAKLSGGRYWNYSLNQMGTEDIPAQLLMFGRVTKLSTCPLHTMGTDKQLVRCCHPVLPAGNVCPLLCWLQIEHIHAVKLRELRPGSGQAMGVPASSMLAGGGAGAEGTAAGMVEGLRRSYSDSVVEAMHGLRPSPFDGPDTSSSGGGGSSTAGGSGTSGTSFATRAEHEPAGGQPHMPPLQQQEVAAPATSARRVAESLDGRPDGGSPQRQRNRRLKELRLHGASPAAGPSKASTNGVGSWSHAHTARSVGEKQPGSRLFLSMFGLNRQPALQQQGQQGQSAAAALAAVKPQDAAAGPAGPAELAASTSASDDEWHNASDDEAAAGRRSSSSGTPAGSPYLTPRQPCASAGDEVPSAGSSGRGGGASTPTSSSSGSAEGSPVAEAVNFRAKLPAGASRTCQSLDMPRSGSSNSCGTPGTVASQANLPCSGSGRGGDGARDDTGALAEATAAAAAGATEAAASSVVALQRQITAPAATLSALHGATSLGSPLPAALSSSNGSDGRGSSSGAGGSGSSSGPPLGAGLSVADRQMLAPDKISIQGVERPGAAEAATQVPLPAKTGSRSARSTAASANRIPAATPGGGSSEPYRLRAVGHSLGGASLLIYAVNCRRLGQPHHLRRLVLLTPAGFHAHYPKALFPFVHLLPLVMWALSRIRPGVGAPVYLPSSLLRYITFKLSYDLQRIPALNELMRAALQVMLSGDKSQWDRALQMPHYNTYGMPAVSLHTGAHFIQLIRTKRFEMFDYGSPAANRAHYGQPRPLDNAANYGLLQGLPIDLVAGKSDGIIAEADVQSHYEAMRKAGVQVTFKAFDVGHLDVTFAVKEEIRRFVLARLQLLDGMPARPPAAWR